MELTVKDIGGIIKKSWIIILVLTLVAALSGYGISVYVLQKEYEAKAMMIVSTTIQNQEGDSNSITLNEYNLNTKLVHSYSLLCKSDRVLTQVRDKLGISLSPAVLSSKISVSSKEDTDIISISVTDTSPQMAQTIANTLVNIFKNEVSEIMKIDNVQVIDYAELPVGPVRPNVLTNTAAGGLAGLVVSLIIAVVRFMLDDTIKESEKITELTQMPVIGIVSKIK